MSEHYCFEGERVYYKNFDTENVLVGHEWHFTRERCIHCGQVYLRAFMESGGFSYSGRWVMGEVAQNWSPAQLDEKSLLAFLYELPRLYAGGSFWKSTGFWAHKDKGSAAYINLSLWLGPLPGDSVH